MHLLWRVFVSLCLFKAFRVIAWRESSGVKYIDKPADSKHYTRDIEVIKNNIFRVRRRIIVERQTDYDSNINDMENLVAEEEASSANANNMAGGNGEGWSQWSPWSTCSVTCGTVGEKTRQRTCQNDPLSGAGCQGADTDSQTCTPDVTECPKTDSWKAWSDWGECSKSCGDGLKTRERSCVVSDPSLSCPGDSSESQSCNLQSCDLKESWTNWSKWSRCSVSCGEGHRSRERVCKDDATKVETSNCPGSKHNSEVCDQTMCSPGVNVKTVHAVEGHSATLKCMYGDMTPPVVIYWLTPDDKRINHQSSDRNYEAIGDALFIHHVGSNMVGLFRCVVHDALGKVLMGEAPIDVLDCTGRPCRNGGLCQEIQAVDHYSKRYTTFRCLCSPGYNGPRCEGGLGPGNIAALFMILLLAVIAGAGICMVYRFRESEKPAKKLISSTESKLIVVTSREALAVSCDEDSTDASLSDSPVHDMNFDGAVRSPPNLKTSRGIGSIFPRWGWNNNNSLQRTQNNNNTLFRTRNNNNSLYRAVPTQIPFLSKANKGFAYSPVRQSDDSKNCPETNTVVSDKSLIDEGDTTNCSNVETSGSSGDQGSTSPSSDTGMGEDVSKCSLTSSSSSQSQSETKSTISSSSETSSPSENVVTSKEKLKRKDDPNDSPGTSLRQDGFTGSVVNQKQYDSRHRPYSVTSSGLSCPSHSATSDVYKTKDFNKNQNNSCNRIDLLVNLTQPVLTTIDLLGQATSFDDETLLLEHAKRTSSSQPLSANLKRSAKTVNEPIILLQTPKRQISRYAQHTLSQCCLFGKNSDVTGQQISSSSCDSHGRLLEGSDSLPEPLIRYPGHPLSGYVNGYPTVADNQPVCLASPRGHRGDEMFIPAALPLSVSEQQSTCSSPGTSVDPKPSSFPELGQTDGLSNNNSYSSALTQTSTKRNLALLPGADELDAVPEVMAINGSGRSLIPSPDTRSAEDLAEMSLEDFTHLFQSLRSKLIKEREKVCIKMKRLTSVVADSTDIQSNFIISKIAADQQKHDISVHDNEHNRNLPTYGEPCKHGTSTPTDVASVMGPQPRFNLSNVSLTSTVCANTSPGQNTGGDSATVCWASLDSPKTQVHSLTYPNHTDSLAKKNQPCTNTDQMSRSEYSPFAQSQDELEFVDISDTVPLLHCL